MSKIFVVDDDHAILKLYRLMLNGVGFDIIDTATNGKIAVEKYRQFPVKPDMILIDYRMPIKNGLDAMVEILQINSSEKIVFASADMDIKERALELGACEFISKPFGMSDVLNVLNRVLRGKIIN
jgi:two-component system chemotaxis response regulator CheY